MVVGGGEFVIFLGRQTRDAMNRFTFFPSLPSKRCSDNGLPDFSACSSYKKFLHELTVKGLIGFSGRKGRNKLAS